MGGYSDPGALGYQYRGAYVVAIHANWPAYPPPGPTLALYDLGQFPEGTAFSPIDEIDQCTLFVADLGKPYADPYDERAFHVAIWNEDLLEMADEGLISGVRKVNEVDKLRAQRDEMLTDLTRSFKPAGLPVPDDPLKDAFAISDGTTPYSVASYWDGRIRAAQEEIDEWDDWQRQYVLIDSGRPVRLTPAGWTKISEVLIAESADVISERLSKIYDLGLYDTAVRDGSVMLEGALKRATRTETYGITLVEQFIRKLDQDERWDNWAVRRFRNDLRTIFKFVRNQFAHNIVDISPARARVLVARLSLLTDAVLDSGIHRSQD
jgi:hypothetical protein